MRPQAAAGAAGGVAPEDADIVAHIQRTGDIPAKLGDWVGTRGSQLWIEGFSLTPRDGVAAADVEYQAVLGRLKNPKDPMHEFLRSHKILVLKPQMATGAKLYYNGLDGSVR